MRRRPLEFILLYYGSVLSFFALAAYLNFFLMDRFLSTRRYAFYIPGVLVIISGTGLMLNAYLVRTFHDWDNLVGAWFNVFLFNVLTAALRLARRGFRQRLLLQELRAKQVQTELSLLKAQINPHFLFNNLNNLFGLARKQDLRTAEGIAQLSHLMRYIIYDSANDRVELDLELEQIHRLIQLQQLRFTPEDDITIDFSVTGKTEGILLPPLLLIPFVENAFKHGISLRNPSFIHIALDVGSGALRFAVHNSNHARPSQSERTLETGLGLPNVRRRLELLYPDAHRLDIQSDGDHFSIELHLEESP
ncbi:MAG: histidine kinase [Acidobacteria bacterium]|nr:histidine kinase [Acidobacteriota bacterium]